MAEMKEQFKEQIGIIPTTKFPMFDLEQDKDLD